MGKVLRSAHPVAVVPCPHAACLKDLQRFLRKDDQDTRDVFFKLGDFDIVRNDLVPLIVSFPDEHDVVYNARKSRRSKVFSWSWGSEHGCGRAWVAHEGMLLEPLQRTAQRNSPLQSLDHPMSRTYSPCMQ